MDNLHVTNLLSASNAAVASTLVASLLVALVSFRSTSAEDHSPPSPKSHPIVGHTFRVPTKRTWRYFDDLSKQLGPIFRLNLAGDEILVLTEPEDVEELLERRSQNYSSRKPLIYAGKYQQYKRIVLLPYGEDLKKRRAAFHQMLQPRTVGAYEAIQDLESIRYIRDMLHRPDQADLNAQRYAAALIFSLTYGKRLADDDKDLSAVVEVLNDFIHDCYPGSHLVDTLPILDKLPDFLAPWRDGAREKHARDSKLYTRLFSEATVSLGEAGRLKYDCFASHLWEERDKHTLDIVTMSYVCSTAFEAGTDTTSGTMMWFILAMLLYPDAQRRAQEEIDTVVGSNGRVIPSFTHFNELPYCSALCREVMRWCPSAPGGFPHLSDKNDEYKGFKINAGTMVIPNVWSLHRNEKRFPEASLFKPDRFFDEEPTFNKLTEGHYGFGFGRRYCPGKFLAAKTVWLGIVRHLWAFTISHEIDPTGNPIPVSPDDCTSGITSKPEIFPARIRPRSIVHVETLESTYTNLMSQ